LHQAEPYVRVPLHVEYQNFTNRVALIYNAVSDSNRKINFRHGGNGDFGLSHVDADDIASQMNSKFKNYFANGKTNTICIYLI
jgi:hypothetical protein